MAITNQRQFRINGVIDTDQPVWQNCELLAESAASFMTYSYHQGQVGVIINAPAQPIKHFTDNNIIGDIDVTEIPLRDLYNSVEIDFPHVDLLDQRDIINFEIPVAQRLERESPSTLKISTDFFNNPVQAQQIALTEIRQSRLNIIVSLTSDYTSMNLTAGDVIELTNEYYGFDQKLFRIVSVSEQDTDDGSITMNFVMIEYSDSVYDYENLSRLIRTRKTGIPGQFVNQNIQTANSVSVAQSVSNAAQTPEGQAALSSGGIPTVLVFKDGWSPSEVAAGVAAPGEFFGLEFGLNVPIKSLQLFFDGPSGFFTYNLDGVNKTVFAGFPLAVSFKVALPGQGFQLRESRLLEWSTLSATVTLIDLPAGSTIRVEAAPMNTLDLSADDPVVAYISGTNVSVQPTGDAASLTSILLT